MGPSGHIRPGLDRPINDPLHELKKKKSFRRPSSLVYKTGYITGSSRVLWAVFDDVALGAICQSRNHVSASSLSLLPPPLPTSHGGDLTTSPTPSKRRLFPAPAGQDRHQSVSPRPDLPLMRLETRAVAPPPPPPPWLPLSQSSSAAVSSLCPRHHL